MKHERGMSFIGMFFVIVLIVFAAIVVMKVMPAYFEYFAVKRALSQIEKEQPASVAQIRQAFDRRAMIDDIKSISSKDLEIQKSGNSSSVSASYQVTVPLFANLSLLIDFSASAGP